MNIKLIDIAKQDASIRQEISNKINEIIDGDNFILGREVAAFEEAFSFASGAKYTIGCSSGTDAITIALKAAGVNPDDDVITVPNSFIATAEAIANIGARVVFCDVNRESMLMDIFELERAITKKTKAIVPVHLHGIPVDIDTIMDIAERHQLKVVFDCAQAHLAQYKGRSIGEFGDFCAYSFFPGKNLGAYGDGGAMTTNDQALALAARQLTNHGRTSMDDKYTHAAIGYNSRIDTIQAGILNVKLPHLEQWTEDRAYIDSLYRQQLKDVPELQFSLIRKDLRSSHHLVVACAQGRDGLVQFLAAKGIQAGIHYPVPIHLQPAFASLRYGKGDFPITEELAGNVISLPTYPGLTEEEILYIVAMIKEYYEK